MKFGEYLRININHLKLEMLRAGSKSLFLKYHKSYLRQINDHGLTLCATEITKDLSLQNPTNGPSINYVV